MTGYERAVRALRFEPTDCVPTWGGWIASADFFEYMTGKPFWENPRAVAFEAYRKLEVDAIVQAGHEVGHHGYLHEHPNERPVDEERYWLQRSIDVIERHTGQRPRGYRAPLYKFSESTLDLLLEEGFTYDASLMADDIPYLIQSNKGDLVELIDGGYCAIVVVHCSDGGRGKFTQHRHHHIRTNRGRITSRI